MRTNTRHKTISSTLRERAETLLNKQARRLDGLSVRDARSLIHELGTHQVELEMQNEELRRAQEELEAAGRKYADLYNFAPVGYFTLDKKGVITEVNLTGASLLGAKKSILIGTPLNSFLASASESRIFFEHRAEALRKGSKAVCEVKMKRKNGTDFYARIESIRCDGCDGAGDAVRTVVIDVTDRKIAEESLRRYARRLVEMEEDIRRKLAAELHDELGRDLAVLGMNFAMLSEDMSRDLRERLGGRIKNVRGSIEDASRIVRNIMAELRPPVLDDYGLLAALRWHCDLFSKHTGIAVNVRVAEPFPRLLPEKELALFRIAQEALVNIAKHAKASHATIDLGSKGGRITVSIADNGKGFKPRTESTAHGFFGWGLTIMRERALSIGAAFRLDSTPGKGTRILVELEGRS